MNCLTCGKPIVGRRPDAKYCCRDCQRRRGRPMKKPVLSETPWQREFAKEWDEVCAKLRNSKKKGETK